MIKFWWKLLGLKLLKVTILRRLENLEATHDLYEQGYNVIRYYFDKNEVKLNKAETKCEIWGKKSIFKRKIKLSKRDKYKKYIEVLRPHELLYQANFIGVVENDFNIYVYKNRSGYNDFSYDISVLPIKYNDENYYETLIYSPYTKTIQLFNSTENLNVHDLVLIGRKGFLEISKNKQMFP